MLKPRVWGTLESIEGEIHTNCLFILCDVPFRQKISSFPLVNLVLLGPNCSMETIQNQFSCHV